MTAASPPYWVLISVLFSNIPLSAALSTDLYQLAHGLHYNGEGLGEIRSELVRGTVQNMKKEVAFGAIAGPLFEASLETERGHATVRFLLTRQGLELAPKPPSAAELN